MKRLVTLCVLCGIVLASADLPLGSAQELLSRSGATGDSQAVAPNFANQSIANQTEQLQTEQLQADIGYLASDELRGRGVGDESIDQAARYIAQRMADIGLETDAISGSPLQPFDVVLGARPAGADVNRLTVSQAGEPSAVTSISLGDSFSPMAVGSSSGEVSGPLVFAGYGITAPKLNYDDYGQIDASGAIVVVLRKEPQSNDPNSRFQGTRNTPHAFFSTKIENAIKHGASAVILVNDPDSVLQSTQNVRSKIFREKQRLEKVEEQLAALPEAAENSRRRLLESVAGIEASVASLEQELQQASRGLLGVEEAGRRGDDRSSIPVVTVARDIADSWLQRFAGSSLEGVETEINENGSPRSLALGDVTASLVMALEPLKTETSNVIGVLPGKGELAAETVVIGVTTITWEWEAMDRWPRGRSPSTMVQTTMLAELRPCYPRPPKSRLGLIAKNRIVVWCSWHSRGRNEAC